MPSIHPFTSLFGRLSIGIALVTILAVTALFFLANGIVKAETERQISSAVDTDIAGLADIYVSGGQAELVARLRDRIGMIRQSGASDHYLLADGTGKPIAGNLSQWPELSSENSESGFISIPVQGEIFARATQLAPNLKLVVGWNLANRDRLLAQLRIAFLIAGLIMVALVVGLGWWSSRRLRIRLAAINAAFRRIGQGQFDTRVDIDNRGDELDELSRHTNEMVSRVTNLVNAHKDISDHTAHELRTPLMHLDNRLVGALHDIPEPDQKIGLIKARADIKNIISLLDSLLDIASSNAKKGDRAGLSEINLSEIARDMADLYSESAEELEIAFEHAIAPDVTMIGEASHIQRIISNLLDNAFKYSPKGSSVSLSVQPGPLIRVRDNGPGVPENMREKIFNRFTRLKSTNASGHGLGLALSKALAARNGLIIRCHDADPGAIFEVTMDRDI
ncbi:sensor histidine kinase [Parasphingorhabdus sp.]|jgi:signal transduction histidine kinase|uniref:sensor histidine kinase n=1 Tax=Parasphingorhabdus sp. TaxID=2709688 RepID=UPI003D2818D1